MYICLSCSSGFWSDAVFFIVVQLGAVCCSVLQRVVVCCSVLRLTCLQSDTCLAEPVPRP